MAEWLELTMQEQLHANAFIELYNALDEQEVKHLTRLGRDAVHWQPWLAHHPKLSVALDGTVPVLSGRVAAFVAESFHLRYSAPVDAERRAVPAEAPTTATTLLARVQRTMTALLRAVGIH